MKRTLGLLALALVLSLGCSDSTGPKIAAVAGVWAYSTTNVQGSGANCSSTGTILTLTQSGATFSGTYAGGTLTCTTPLGPVVQQITTGVVANGTVSESAVSFNLDTSDWTNTGSISGTTMTGTLVVRVVIGGTSAVLTGSFTATKQ
jgi:hypothetical protein